MPSLLTFSICTLQMLYYKKISDETNMYAHQFLETEGPNLKPYSIVHGWKDTNPEEVRTFLGNCVLMGLIHKPRIWMYWSTDTLYNTPFHGQLMTRTRFLLLNKFLHFQDNQHPGYDPNDPTGIDFLKSETSWICWKKSSTQYIILLSTLQWMRASFCSKKLLLYKQYIKSKRSRFGINF